MCSLHVTIATQYEGCAETVIDASLEVGQEFDVSGDVYVHLFVNGGDCDDENTASALLYFSPAEARRLARALEASAQSLEAANVESQAE